MSLTKTLFEREILHGTVTRDSSRGRLWLKMNKSILPKVDTSKRQTSNLDFFTCIFVIARIFVMACKPFYLSSMSLYLIYHSKSRDMQDIIVLRSLFCLKQCLMVFFTAFTGVFLVHNSLSNWPRPHVRREVLYTGLARLSPLIGNPHHYDYRRECFSRFPCTLSPWLLLSS